MTDAIRISPRKMQIARMVHASATNKQIAAALGMSVRRVEEHLDDLARLWHLDRAKNLRVQVALRFSTDYSDRGLDVA